jgi:hypothetical protein
LETIYQFPRTIVIFVHERGRDRNTYENRLNKVGFAVVGPSKQSLEIWEDVQFGGGVHVGDLANGDLNRVGGDRSLGLVDFVLEHASTLSRSLKGFLALEGEDWKAQAAMAQTPPASLRFSSDESQAGADAYEGGHRAQLVQSCCKPLLGLDMATPPTHWAGGVLFGCGGRIPTLPNPTSCLLDVPDV